jgi:uncharacterized membrane protein HdeD (DUF308 family)
VSPDTSRPAMGLSGGRTLGLFWLIYGILRIIAAVWMLGFTPTATVMFGALLNRVPNPYPLMSVFHLVYAGWIVLSAASGIFGVLAGISLLARAGRSQILAIVAALLGVPFIPVGTMLGAYTLARFVPRD